MLAFCFSRAEYCRGMTCHDLTKRGAMSPADFSQRRGRARKRSVGGWPGFDRHAVNKPGKSANSTLPAIQGRLSRQEIKTSPVVRANPSTLPGPLTTLSADKLVTLLYFPSSPGHGIYREGSDWTGGRHH